MTTASGTMPFYGDTSAPLYVPVPNPPPPAPVYVPPPPPPPLAQMPFQRCNLCRQLMAPEDAVWHHEFHKANGLHGPYCEAIKSLRRQLDHVRAELDPLDLPDLEPCTCGLEPAPKKETADA